MSAIEQAVSRLGSKIAKFGETEVSFQRGTLSRALRDILAKRLRKHVDHIQTPFALATSMIKKGYLPLPPFSKSEKRLLKQKKKNFDPARTSDGVPLSQILAPELEAGEHAYLGRSVMDLGKGHAHAIIDIPWEGIKVKYDPDKPFDVLLDPTYAMLRLVKNPAPSKRKDLIEIQVVANSKSFDFVKTHFADFFTHVSKDRLIRRGSDPRPTGIFIDRE